jgi:hypothetical protein
MAKSTIRKVGSLFFLGIFLWFYSVKDLHDIMHADDEHCHVQNAKHFHTQEHHCPICEFEFPGFDDQTLHVEVSSHSFFIKVQNLYTVQVISCEPVSLSPSRAPPLVA